MESKRSAKAEEILDAAEQHMRRGGFDAVSYRVLATDVGIKSASVHYHFPQKADLGRAVVDRYGGRFLDSLGRPDDPDESREQRLMRLAAGYRASLSQYGTVCLCCILGAERHYLPETVAEATASFYRRLLEWTEIALGTDDGDASALAAHVIAALQGAMVLAVALDRDELIASSAEQLTKLL